MRALFTICLVGVLGAADDQPGALSHVLRVRSGRRRELAVRIPAIPAVYLGDRMVLQKGSPESKELGKAGTESDEDQKVAEYADEKSPPWARVRGRRLTLYSNSLGLTMAAIFLLSWLAQSIAGRAFFNEQQINALQDPVSWLGYCTSSDFWNRTLQNWQSEFLAVASMVVLSIYLRQRGSPESKPVGSSHLATGVEG